MRKNCIVVCGPTATGKTLTAVRTAYALCTEIISADSRQVYRHMDIGTGKDLEEYTINGIQIPFHLINIQDPSDTYTLYNYQKDFYTTFSKIISKGRIPVVSGGTGLYIEAVCKGYILSDVGEHPEFRKAMMKRDKQSIYSDLMSRLTEREAESVDTSSKKRMVRALEIAEFSSIKPGSLNQAHSCVPNVNPYIFCLYFTRKTLRRRIEKRFYKRLCSGMIQEVSDLLDSGITRERMMMLGLEYKYITKYLTGQIRYTDMVKTLITEIQRFSKRQMTFFRGMERRGLGINWIRGEEKDSIPIISRDMVDQGKIQAQT